MHIELDDIRLFVKVAELKSFVAAATELNMQTSSLSRRIAELESALGVRLLQRTTRRVSLTAEGEQFLSDTVIGLGELQNAVDALHSLRGEPKGRLRMASPIEIGQHLMQNSLPDFFRKYPDIDVEWDLFGNAKSLVENGIDLSIRTFQSTEQSLIERKLGELSFRLYRAPNLSWPFKNLPSVAQLEELPWVVFTRNELTNNRVKFNVIIDSETVEIKPKHIRFRANSFVSVRHAIVQGLGIGLLPGPLAEPELNTGNLVVTLPKRISGPPLQFYAVYPSKRYLAPKVRVMLDWLIKNFPNG